MSSEIPFQIIGKNGRSYLLEIIKPENLGFYINEIALFRIKYFKEFPYSYEGNLEYEQKYISGFSKDPRSLLIVIWCGSELIGVSTALPLVSKADILDEAPQKFAEHGLNPSEFYYYGEIIIKPEHQGQGIASILMKKQDALAKELGLKKVTLATVVRDENDARRPKNYVCTDAVWRSQGFKKENMYITYEWPTILADKTVRSIANLMVFWTKTLD